VIAAPQTPEEHAWCREQLKPLGIEANEKAHILLWLRDGKPVWYVVYDSWLGTTCQMHMASRQAYVPKKLCWTAFNYAFNMIGRTHVFGIVNSNNTNAMRLDRFFGFQEMLRVPGAHMEGGDIVIFMMTAADWKAKHG
jgi:hypothetical protein